MDAPVKPTPSRIIQKLFQKKISCMTCSSSALCPYWSDFVKNVEQKVVCTLLGFATAIRAIVVLKRGQSNFFKIVVGKITVNVYFPKNETPPTTIRNLIILKKFRTSKTHIFLKSHSRITAYDISRKNDSKFAAFFFFRSKIHCYTCDIIHCYTFIYSQLRLCRIRIIRIFV